VAFLLLGSKDKEGLLKSFKEKKEAVWQNNGID
jgi:hypothetical protein